MDFLYGEDIEPALNEHQIAWYNKDTDAIKKLADQYKVSKENELFDILNNLTQTKKPVDVKKYDNYSKFAIDLYFIGSPDTAYQAYVANLLLHNLSDQSHYNYMLNALPRGKKYIKSVKSEYDIVYLFKIKLLQKIYSVSSDRAHEYYVLLKKKKVLSSILSDHKAYVTDDFLKEITKNVKEHKELRELL